MRFVFCCVVFLLTLAFLVSPKVEGQQSRDYSRHCVEGVLYLEFSTGVTVEYAPNGDVRGCSK
jgi:hypothetical protein